MTAAVAIVLKAVSLEMVGPTVTDEKVVKPIVVGKKRDRAVVGERKSGELGGGFDARRVHRLTLQHRRVF